jgi:hypothetical protein
MAGNSEEGQGPQRAVAPMMMMNKNKLSKKHWVSLIGFDHIKGMGV